MINDDFEKVVKETLEELPAEFKSQLNNVEIVIENQPTEEDLQGILKRSHAFLLGLYRGVPKTKRFSYSALPDKITIFKEPILIIAKDIDDAKRIIRDTVLHELGHHFGLSDADINHAKKK